jgi:hypothetical protein
VADAPARATERDAGLREDSAPVTIAPVGAEIWIYSLVCFTNAEGMCEHHVLLGATRRSFSNASQCDEDRASDLADSERERLTERYGVGVLAERCGARHEPRLLGEDAVILPELGLPRYEALCEAKWPGFRYDSRKHASVS